MKLVNKCLYGMFLIMFCLSLTSKNGLTSTFVRYTEAEASMEVTRAEETGYKYKIVDGKLYKRLWSYTYGRWIDDDWILVE